MGSDRGPRADSVLNYDARVSRAIVRDDFDEPDCAPHPFDMSHLRPVPEHTMTATLNVAVAIIAGVVVGLGEAAGLPTNAA